MGLGCLMVGRISPRRVRQAVDFEENFYLAAIWYANISLGLIDLARPSYVIEPLELFRVHKVSERDPYGVGKQAQVID